MIEKRHYLKTTKLYGQQLKYLIKSVSYGWIGALAFSSGSWRLKPRDQQIGWDDETRRKNCNRSRGSH
ncbi:MAG: DUF4338 domain-containing protein [Candidatus Omnitrophica bacterium]|nr:DUF4338 domain-containing protein [Candidatus Omnitrophota bacterium]